MNTLNAKNKSNEHISNKVRQIFFQNSEIIPSLQKIGIKLGFGCNNMRKKAWAKIVCIKYAQMASAITPQNTINPNTLDQIRMDVRRSFTKKETKNILKDNLKKARIDLEKILVSLLRGNSGINYTQGLHEFISTIYLVCGYNESMKISKILIDNFYRDFLEKNFAKSKINLSFSLHIIKLYDREIYCKITDSHVDSYFLMSWILTWFSHDQEHIDEILKIYDFILSTNLVMPYYIAASKVILGSEKLLETSDDQSEILFYLLSLNKTIPTTKTLKHSIGLIKKIPPCKILEAMGQTEINKIKSSALLRNINNYETIKTTKKTKITKILEKSLLLNFSEIGPKQKNPVAFVFALLLMLITILLLLDRMP